MNPCLNSVEPRYKMNQEIIYKIFFSIYLGEWFFWCELCVIDVKYSWWSDKCDVKAPDIRLSLWLFVKILSISESQVENLVGSVITGTKTADITSLKNQDNVNFHESLASQCLCHPLQNF